MAKLIVIEDDPDLLEHVADFLSFEHHQVETAQNCREARDKLGLSSFDVLIVDWELPDGTGIELIREFRSGGGSAPVIMLTGKGKLADKTEGFRVGSDDYLTKPFELDELSLRVNALLRRPRALIANTLQVRNIVLDPEAYRVTKGGVLVDLQPREFALLQFLMRNVSHVFSTEALLERVWPSDAEVSPQAVVASIRRLRQKIEADGEKPLIQTLHGVGYKLEP